MNFKSIMQSHTLKIAIFVIIALALMCAAFQIGTSVGFRKANFSFRWGDNYHRMFAGPKRGFFDDFEGRGFINAHGVFGTVIKVEGNDMIIKDKDNVEKTVVTTSSTTINIQRDRIQISDIKINDTVVVIGGPDEQGRIAATLIRVFDPKLPPPPVTRSEMRRR